MVIPAFLNIIVGSEGIVDTIGDAVIDFPGVGDDGAVARAAFDAEEVVREFTRVFIYRNALPPTRF